MKLKFMLATVFALVFVGCSNNQSSVDITKKEIKIIDGKHYMVPAGASTSSYAVNSKVIKRFQDFGVSDCQEGDITWEDQKVANAINEVMRNGKKSEGITIYTKAADEGRIGCASPLSDEEYQAVLNK